MTWLAIAVGGALGSCLRYALSVAVGSAGASTAITWMPLGTFLANALGSFGLGLVASMGDAGDGYSIAGVDVDAKLFLGVGLMGGFTTYSTFNFETLRLIESGQVRSCSLAHRSHHVLTCLIVGALGLLVGRALRS